MSKLNIRKAVASDVEALKKLIKQLGYDITKEQLEKNIELPTSKAGHHIYVAENTEGVVGFASLHINYWFHRCDGFARMSSIVTDQKYRGTGIGKTLVQFLENIAKEAGCTTIEVTSSLRRKEDGTYDFYVLQGYNDECQSTYFRKSL